MVLANNFNQIVSRLYQPTSGDIYINGRPISEYSKEACYQLFLLFFKILNYSLIALK